jgi:type I restriction enzyme, S subunit
MGYKVTKLGWIPTTWQTSVLKDTSIRITDGEHNTPRRANSGHYLLSARNVRDGSIDLTDVDFVDSEEFRRLSKRIHPRAGDLLVSCSGSIGRCAVVPEGLQFAMVRSVALVRPNPKILDSMFLQLVVSSDLLQRQMQKAVNQLAQGNLFQGNIENLTIPLPFLSEQKKIAEILSAWGQAIERARKLLECKKRRKKALIQKLLGGKRALGDSNEKIGRLRRLGEVLVPVSRPVPKPKNPYISIGLRSHGKGTFQRIVDEPDNVVMDTLYRVEKGDLLVNITFAWEGAIAFASQKDSGGLVSHRFPTYRLKETEVDKGFFQNLIQTKGFVWELGLISPGGAGRNRVLSQKDFLKLKVRVPKLEIQRRMGEILESTDHEVRLCEEYLMALEKQKRGLMQKLLTGEVRVKL